MLDPMKFTKMHAVSTCALLSLMEELHTDSIDGGHEGQLWARSRARERAYSNNHAYFFYLPLVQRMNALHTSYTIDQYCYY
jgi:hypothetical protein